VRGSDQQVQVEGPILAVFEGPEPVEDEGLAGRGARPKLFVEEQAVTAEAFGLALQCAVRDTELAADLSQAGPADEAVEEGFEELGVSQPIAGGEGLRTEVPAAMMTLVPLNLVRAMGAMIEAFLLVTPRA
jgi:hypothetical protein